MEHSQFETLMLAIQGLRVEFKADLKSEIGSLRTELKGDIAALRAEMNTRFDVVNKDIRTIREQTATTVMDVADLKVRVAKLEGASA